MEHSPIFKGKQIQDFLIAEDEIDILSRNVGTELSLYDS
jgi:hypothetical protein